MAGYITLSRRLEEEEDRYNAMVADPHGGRPIDEGILKNREVKVVGITRHDGGCQLFWSDGKSAVYSHEDGELLARVYNIKITG